MTELLKIMFFYQLLPIGYKKLKNITSHLNVNSLTNNIEAVTEVISKNIDTYLLSETKIDETFPNEQFNITNYKALRQDRNKNGGGLSFYINENIPCKVINDEEITNDIEMILFEFLLKT